MIYLKLFEELKYDTYQSAASKLKKLGHKERADKLNYWSMVSNNRDISFNMAFDISERIENHWKTKKPYSYPNIKPFDKETSEKILKEGPFKCYFTGGMVTDPLEQVSEENITEIDSIGICCFFTCEEYSESFLPFFIGVKIEWNLDDKTFKISDEPISFEAGDINDYQKPLRFSDRSSAVSFKNTILTREILSKKFDFYKEIDEFFKEYSDGIEWAKFFDKIKSISINQLFTSSKRSL